MPENDFAAPQDLLDYYARLKDYHSARIRVHMMTQAMWEQALGTTDTGRTVYVNNEPWAATRLAQNLIDNGSIRAKVMLPPDPTGEVDAVATAKQQVEDLVSCILTETDERLHARKRDTLKREMAWDMYVLGWYAGIALVLDNAKGSPWFVDNWSPTDTFPEMEGGTALVHRSMMARREIESVFGRKRKGGKLPGYAVPFEDEHKQSDKFEVGDYWDGETNATIVLLGAEPYWAKKQTAHKCGHNPTWCNPVNAIPARYVATDRKGKSLQTPDAETNRWLAFVGQSPLLGILPIYRVISEFVNQIQDVIEQWADVKVVVVTQDGKFREVDLTKRDGSPVANLKDGERLDILAPSAFPAPLKDWLMFLLGELQKVSFPPAVYGQIPATEATGTLQMIRETAGYIIGPIASEVRTCYHQFLNSLLRQLESAKRGAQYTEAMPMLATDVKGAQYYTSVNLSEIPKGARVAIELKGAGIKPDRLGMLAATNQVANSPNPVVDDETLLDLYLEVDSIPDVLERKLVQKLTTHPEVIGALAPITTALKFHQQWKKQAAAGNEVAGIMADMSLATAKAGVQKLQQLVAGPAADQGGGAPTDPKAAAMAALAAAGGPNGGPGGPQGLQGDSQVQGVAAPGAPVAGVPQPSTGAAPNRGAEMAASAAMTGP